MSWLLSPPATRSRISRSRAVSVARSIACSRSISGAAPRCLALPAEKFADDFLPSLPCGLALDEHVVVGLELDELCVGDARRDDAALIERHHHVAARMQDQRGRLHEFHAFD